MYAKKIVDGKKVLSPAQISRLYNVSRPTAGKWAEDGSEGENKLAVYKVNKKTFVLDSEANHKELSYLKEKGARYKSKNEYEKVGVNQKYTKSLSPSGLKLLSQSLKDGFLNPKFHFLKSNQNSRNRFFKFFTNSSDFNYQENFTYLAKTYLSDKIKQVQVLNYSGVSNLNENLISKGFSGLDIELKNYYKEALEGDTETEFESIFEKTKDKKSTAESPKNLSSSEKATFFVATGGYLSRLRNPYQGLSEIYEKMENEDFLWLDFELATENQIILKDHYYRETSLFTWLTSTLHSLGLDQSFYKLKVAQNKENKEYSVFAQWKKDIDLNWSENSESPEINLKSSDKMILEQVKLHTFSEVQDLLTKSGFEIKQNYLNPNNTKVDVLVQKAKISSDPEILYER
jgi:hypothetical protein